MFTLQAVSWVGLITARTRFPSELFLLDVSAFQ